MGALQGTLTYKLFYLEEEVPDDFLQGVLERIRHRAFEPLDPDEEEEERYGWVPIENPLRVEFEHFNVVFDHFINLGLRHDKYALPSALVKAHVAQSERDYMVQHDKERLSKFEKEDIKLMVRKQLKARSLPRMKVIDMSWDFHSGRVRFFNQSAKTCELFQGLFEDTFGLKLYPANPYINARDLDLSPEQLERLSLVDPSVFAPH